MEGLQQFASHVNVAPMQNRITLKNYDQESRLFRRRVLIFAAFFGILTLILIGRLAYLQIIQHAHYTTLSDQNQLALIPIEPNRGLIYDRNGVLLAENIPTFSLDVIPDRIPDLTSSIKKLQAILNIDDETVALFNRHRKQHRSFEPVPLKLKLSEQEVAKFYVNQHDFPGVMVTARMTRHYPDGPEMVNFLGYVGRINESELKVLDRTDYSASNHIGKVGIERYYENQLHGKVGYDQVEVNAAGRNVRTIEHHAPEPGENLFLTIDSRLQHVAHEAFGPEKGALVAIKPKTGEVLALVSHPSYDPNDFTNGVSKTLYNELKNSEDKPLYNRALRGQYPLASTIKPFLALQALNLQTMDPEQNIRDPGWFTLPNSSHVFKDWRKEGHGMVNLQKAIIVSCDIYFYTLAVKMGIKNIASILKEFGFGSLSGIDILEELPGVVPTPEWKYRTQHVKWYPGDTVISGIGQGFMLTTPLQLASAVATIANKGIRYQPHLVYSSQNPKGETKFNPIIPETPVKLENEEYWDYVIEAMEGVISSTNPSGTGYKFGRNPPYTAAGKSGTAQIYRPPKYADLPDEMVPKRYQDHSLFIVFAPKKDPEIALAIVVENSKAAQYIARKVIDTYLLKDKP